ncbi:hypothetical protein VPH35_066099 [Triticum aestivum]
MMEGWEAYFMAGEHETSKVRDLGEARGSGRPGRYRQARKRHLRGGATCDERGNSGMPSLELQKHAHRRPVRLVTSHHPLFYLLGLFCFHPC